jgi:hypothetical protein
MNPTHPLSEKQAILIDLDALLDTRIATVSQINEQAAVKLLQCKEYYTRNLNDFSRMCGVNKTIFDRQFALRNIDTLKISLPTACVIALRMMVADLARQHDYSPFAQEVKLVVNCYPYVLESEEKLAIAEVVGAYTGVGAERVEMITMSYTDLIPSYIKSHFTGMFLYNYREWMEAQSEDAFQHCRMPEIVVLAPALYKDRIPDRSEINIPGAEQYSLFELTEGFLVGAYDLNFLDLTYFSVIPPEELSIVVEPGLKRPAPTIPV